MTKLWKNDVLWNAVGSLVYALASMVLAFAVIRLAGARDGGIFGFGFSTLGQQMFIVSYFGIRPFQITDMKPEYRFGDYLRTRRLTSGLALLGVMVFLGFMCFSGQYDSRRAMILLLLSGWKILDGYADVYESELQRQGLLYRCGQSLCFRTLLSVLVLLLSLGIGRNLLLSCLLADLTQLFGIWCFGVRPLPETVRRGTAARDNVFRLLKQTGLLFFSVFLDFYIFSASKYAVDSGMGAEVSGIFNILFMPTSFIYLIANFLVRPMLTRLAADYSGGERESFRRCCRFMLLAVSGLAIVITLGALIFGGLGLRIFEWLLGSGYTGRFLSERRSFVLLILGGGLYALANVQYYILVTLRCQREIFCGYVLAAIAALLTAGRMVQRMALLGGSLNYVLLMLLLFLLFTAFALRACRRWERSLGE